AGRSRRTRRRRGKTLPIAITGGGTTLGQAFARLCDARGLSHILLSPDEFDIGDAGDTETVLAELRPWAVVNAADYHAIEEAERLPRACYRQNSDGPALLAAACARHGVALLTFSSDLVFDGTRTA